ncbi:MAG: putative 2OG-Fe(II) oxygenase [Woeseiaceae bacterium]|nr:putative 2OG-Fe(II) oxygenase [Woeseiaceae bacterium]
MNPIEQAISAGRSAIERGDPNAARSLLSGVEHPEAAYLLAISNTHLGLYDDAVDAYRLALTFEPRFDQARRTLGRLLVDLERYEDALPEYERVLDHEPESLPARYGYATALLGVGRAEEAEAIFDALIDEGNDRPEIRFMRARGRLELGQVEQGILDLENAFERQPADYNLKSLAGTLWMRGEHDRFDALLEQASKEPPLVAMTSELYRQSGAPQRSVEVIESARPGGLSADALATLSQAHADLGDAAAAEEAAREGIAVDAHHQGSIANLIIALLMQNKAETALELVEVMRAAEPLRQHWIAYEATAWRIMGDERYAELVDIDRFVRPYELPVPDGFDSIDDFNAAFLEALDHWQKYTTQPLDQSLRQGIQTTRDLTGIEDPVIEAYVRALDTPIRAYMEAVGNSADHPLTARNTGEYRITGSWSVRLHGGGWHVNHVHPEGWISSAYYASVPDDVEDESSHSGWIKFGEPPFVCEPPLEPEKWIKPKAGILVLFPSFMWHGTAPISGDSTRVTAPFDVVPR